MIGAGVVGSGVSLELARRNVKVALLEAEPEPGLAASGTNSGILHTGFDSTPGELETALILSSARLRDEITAALGIPTLDGLGAVGDGAHSSHEHVLINTMPQRAALLAALLAAR